jgi:hypothetical protein
MLQVENQEFGHRKPLKIRIWKSVKIPKGKDLGTIAFGYIAYGRRQNVA